MNSALKSHTLSAGLTGDVKLVKDGTVSANNLYLNCLATPVDIVKIASLNGDDTKNVVFGVEPGKTIYCTNTTYPMAATTKRVANIGLHVSCLTSLTEEAFKLIDAAVAWTVSSGTRVSELSNSGFAISLMGNNAFRLDNASSGAISLNVFSIAGSRVTSAPVMHGQSFFDLTDQPKGVCFVQVNGNERYEIKKIVIR